jgi:long-chain acyl-CoA synthetase
MNARLYAAAAETAVELLARRARSTPRLVATRHETADGQWMPTTYAELWREVSQARDALAAQGIRPGDRVAILAPACRLWQVAEFAAQAARAVVVGIEPHAPPAMVHDLLGKAQARVLFVNTPRRLDDLPRSTLSRLDQVVVFEPVRNAHHSPLTAHHPPLTVWNELCDLSHRHSPKSTCSEEALSGDDLATVFHTSGTTGRPTRIAYAHRQIMFACRAIVDLFGEIEPGDRLISWLPMAPLFQRMMNLVAFANGAEVFFVDDPRRVVEVAGRIGPAVFIGVPRIYEKLHAAMQDRLAALPGWRRHLAVAALRTAGEYGRRLRNGSTVPISLRAQRAGADRFVLRKLRRVMGQKLKFMVTGSAPAAPWLVEFFHDVGMPLLDAYGLSENAVPIAANRRGAWRVGSVGKPLKANELRIEPDGEIVVRSPGVYQGGGEQDRFTTDGFLRTGDLGSLDAEGYLYLRGRKSEIIKTSNGRRIAPGMVEAAYGRSPFLEHVVVVGDGRSHLVGLVTLCVPAVRRWLAERRHGIRPEEFADREDIQALVAQEIEFHGAELAACERIARFAILRHGLSVSEGELTQGFKVRRGRVIERYADVIDGLYRESALGRERTLVGVL